MKNNILFSYIDKLSTKLNLNLMVLLLSFLIFTIWHLFGAENLLSFSYIHISIGHIGYIGYIGYIGLILFPAFLIIEKEYLQKWWVFFSGLVLLDLPALMFITNNKPIDNSIFFSSISLTILLFLFLITTLYGISKSITSMDFITKKKNLLVVFISSLFFTLVYHGANYYLKEIKNVANEERSFFIGSLEFHHINYGIILLVLVPFIYKYASRLSGIYSFLAYAFIGFIYGTVFDEGFYYMLQDVSDEAYLEFIPNMISLIIMLISFGIWFYIINKKKDTNNA